MNDKHLMNKKSYLAGEDGSGKSSLMAKLQGTEHNKKGRGLEYLYLNVHDEDRDGEFISYTFLSLWLLYSCSLYKTMAV